MGLAHLWKQGAFRVLGSYSVLTETERTPALNVSVGMQGIGTGNPGYSATLEKNWRLRDGTLNLYGGIGFRSNEAHGHLVGGAKFAFTNGLTLGLQDDGHQRNPFATMSFDRWTFGVYFVGGERPAYLLGVRF